MSQALAGKMILHVLVLLSPAASAIKADVKFIKGGTLAISTSRSDKYLQVGATPVSRTITHDKKSGGGYNPGSPLYGKSATRALAAPLEEPKGKRNGTLFLIILCLAVGVLSFAMIKVRATVSPPKAVPAAPGNNKEQSTLMSEMFPRAQNRWEHRGVLLGIMISVSSLSGLFLNALAMQAMYTDWSVWIECKEGGPFGMGWWEAQFCSYTSSYIWTAPQLALAGALLLVGRGILQYRLYYNLLKAGGVLDYHKSTVFKDPVFLMLLWWYAHMLMYTGFIVSLIDAATANDQSSSLHKFHDNKMQRFLVFALVPFTIFIYLFYSAYGLEGKLVPLSEFITNSASGHKELDNLSVVDESVARELLLSPPPLMSDALAEQAKFALTVQLCNAQMQDPAAQVFRPSNLFTYLWPSELLLSKKTQGKNADLFRILWRVFLVFAVLLIVLSMALLAFMCYIMVVRRAFLSLAVGVVQLAVTGGTLKVFISASAPLFKSS